MTKSGLAVRLLGATLLTTVAVWPAVGLAASDAITVVITDEPKSLDPCDTDLSANARILRNNVTQTLVNLDPANGEVLPSLAVEWRQIDDLTWEFKLREGVTFHDGSPFDAEAVAASLTRGQDPALACEVGLATLKDVKFTPEVVDATTLIIRTDVVEPILPNKMAAVDIYSAATPGDAKTRQPIGTGPYAFVAWSAGQSVQLKAFEGYWGEQPAIANATITWRAESAVRAAMVDTGEAQVAYEIAPQDATSENDIAFPNAETSLLRIDEEIAPLNDKRVREAMNLAIDRDGLIGTIFHEQAQKAMQVVLPSVFGYNPDIPVWAYDPDGARALLEQARADGVPVDTEIVLYGRIGIYPNSAESMEAIQAMLLDVGFNVRLEMMETSPWLEKLLKPYPESRAPSVLQTQIDNTEGDAVFTLPNRFTTTGNTSTVVDPALDEMIAKAARATGDERKAQFQEAFRYIALEAVNIVPLFHMVTTARVSPDLNYVPDVQAGNEIKLSTMSYK